MINFVEVKEGVWVNPDNITTIVEDLAGAFTRINLTSGGHVMIGQNASWVVAKVNS